MSEPHPQRRAALAAFLSFLFPGLGQAYGGRRQLAAILALPVLVLLALALVSALFLDRSLTNVLLSATALWTLLVIDLALMGWRLLAIAEAGFIPRVAVRGAVPVGVAQAGGFPRRGPSGREWRVAFVTLLLAVTVLMHGYAGIVLTRLDSTLGNVFSGSGAQQDGADADGGAPINEPEYRWDGTERVNFLLLGVDSGPGRDEALTDTILVVSVDPVAESAVMVSVPRDTALVPLPDTSVYPDALYPMKINQLSTDARLNPAAWCPDLPESEAAACGIRALERAIGTYLGIPIQYYAQVDLRGFAQLIDAVGGVTLCLDGEMVDVEYTGPGVEGRGIVLPAGCSQYDGALALAYARSRKGYIELPDGTREQQDDFKRADRQQKVLLELRSEIASADIIFELPSILDAVGETVTTDFPRGKAGDLASLVPLVTGSSIERVVLGLPDYVSLSPEPLVNYYLTPKKEVVRDKMAELFGGVDELEGWYMNDEPPPAG